jgi:hypothetical protein
VLDPIDRAVPDVFLKALIIINASEEKPDDSYSPIQKSK